MKKKIRFYAITITLFILISGVNISNAQRGGRGVRFGFGGGGSNFHFKSSYATNSYRNPIYRSTGYRLPYNHIRLFYGGNPYYYSNGLFYSSYGLTYNLIRPPFGIRLGFLPNGYWPLNFGGYPYYYYGGTFYQNTQDNQYQVVQPPVGATVPSIPKGAKKIVVNGEPVYDYLGTFYKEVIDQNGKVSYQVQGKDGVLNTNQQQEVTVGTENTANSKVATNYIPGIGDIVLQLPSQYMVVVINDKKLYVTPEHIYYEEFIDNGILKYKVVGK